MPATVLVGSIIVSGTWYLLSVVVFFVTLLMVGLILIQDSKDTGLTSAFGGGGNTSLLGARMQKDLAKLTAILSGILAVCLVAMAIITTRFGDETKGTQDSLLPPPNVPDAGAAPSGNPLGAGFPLELNPPGSGLPPTPGAPNSPSTTLPPVTLPPVAPPVTPVPPATGAAPGAPGTPTPVIPTPPPAPPTIPAPAPAPAPGAESSLVPPPSGTAPAPPVTPPAPAPAPAPGQ